VRDILEKPTEQAFKISARVVAAVVVFGVLVAIRRNGDAARALSPAFAGLVLGLVAFRHPVAAVAGVWALASVVWVSVSGDEGYEFVVAGIVMVPMGSVAAICAANVRRWFRGRSAEAELTP
jgi:hypothetical protein